MAKAKETKDTPNCYFRIPEFNPPQSCMVCGARQKAAPIAHREKTEHGTDVKTFPADRFTHPVAG